LKSSSKAKPKSQANAWNQSRVKSYLRCRTQYHYRYDSHGEPGMELVRKHTELPLKKGTWCHALLEAHWNSVMGVGKGWEKTHKKLTKEFGKLFVEEQERYGDLPGDCERLFRGYLRRWKNEDDQFKVARLANGKPAIEFIVEFPLAKWGIDRPFKGKIDLMVEDLEYGGLWLRDAKWVKTIPGPDERMMSPQNIMYVWVARKMGYDVRGFIYDYGRTKTPAAPYILQNGTVTTRNNIDTTFDVYLKAIKDTHPKEWKKLAKTYYKDKLLTLKARDVLWYHRERIPVEGPRVQNGFREFILAVKEIENRGRPIRSYLYNCVWNCSYHDLCVADFQGLDTKPIIKSRYMLEGERYGTEEIE